MPKPSKPKKPSEEATQLRDSIADHNWVSDIRVKSKHKMGKVHAEFFRTGIEDSTNILFVDGPAGSAKTYTAAYIALVLLQRKKIDKIYYVRTVVESAEKSLGFLPGELSEKFSPYLVPLLEKLDELVDYPSGKTLVKEKVVEAVPMNFWRGRTARDSVVIVDESQNFSAHEILTVITRIGDNCKFIVLGDGSQSDIGSKSGYRSMFNVFDDQDAKDHGIHCFRFTEVEVVRSEILKYILCKLNSANLKEQPVLSS